MSEIREVKLPGVGARFEFETQDGKVVGVVTHRTGRREIYVASGDDKDRFDLMLGLTSTDARILAELLGASRVSEELADLQQRIEGLVIDWLPLREDSPYAGRPMGDARIRTRTGVSLVAVVRGDEAFPVPGPDLILVGGDYLVVVGTHRGIEDLVEILRGG
jgi:TrkA domain protein